MLESLQIKLSNLQYKLQKARNDLTIACQTDTLHNTAEIINETQWMILKKSNYKQINNLVKNIVQIKHEINNINTDINCLITECDALITKKNKLFVSYKNQRIAQNIFKKAVTRNFLYLKNNVIFDLRKAQNKLEVVKILFIYIDPISTDKLLNIEFLLNEINDLHQKIFTSLKK